MSKMPDNEKRFSHLDDEEEILADELPENATIIGYDEDGNAIYVVNTPGSNQSNKFGENNRNEGGRKSWWK